MKAKKSTNKSKSRSKTPLIAAVCIMLAALVAIVAISGNGTEGVSLTGGSDNTAVSATEVEAMSPMEFPDEAMVVTGSEEISYTGYLSGTLTYKFNSLEVYDNLYEAGITTDDLAVLETIDTEGNARVISDNEFYPITTMSVPYYYDGETGQLMDNLYLLLFEVEITNVDADFSVGDSAYQYAGTGQFRREELPELYNVSRACSISLFYLRESSESVTGSWLSFEVQQGETKTFHIGYIIGGSSEEAFSNLVIYVGRYDLDVPIAKYILMDDCSDLCYYFNLTEVINDFKSSN